MNAAHPSAAMSWQEVLDTYFPAYLLPNACRHAIPVDCAVRFLERLTGNPGHLRVLRMVSLLSAKRESAEQFAFESLPDLVRVLPSQSISLTREWRGGFHGRLDIPGTLGAQRAGDPTLFVTRTRRRTFNLPENQLVRTVAEQLLAWISELRRAGVLEAYGWADALLACEGQLRLMLSRTLFRDVDSVVVDGFHYHAARAARHRCFEDALDWYSWMDDALSATDDEATARLIAAGALTPVSDPTRFEIAVLIRLILGIEMALEQAADGRVWGVESSILIGNRKDVVRFVRDDGLTVRVHYNQAVLPQGDRDLGVRHYFGETGRLRPDLTIIVEKDGEPVRAIVVEIKLSDDPSYWATGFEEALLYRWEYRNHLTGWPKAIVVVPGRPAGRPRREDDVIVSGWDQWPQPEVVEGILALT